MDDYNFEDRDQLVEDLLKILEQGSVNDVKIKLRDGEISANKDFLMGRSDYFKTMFNSKFKEGETNTVDMSHSSKIIMEKIIKFLFTGAVIFDDLTLPQLLEMSHLSKMLLLDKFQEEVNDFIQNDKIQDGREDVKILPDLISAMKYADQYNLEDINENIKKEIFCGLKVIPGDVNCSDCFKKLPFKFIKEIFLFDGRRMNRLFLPTTKQKFDCFVMWLSNNEIEEEEEAEIVESFQSEDFTINELLTDVRKSRLYQDITIDERVLELLQEKRNKLQLKERLLNDKGNKHCEVLVSCSDWEDWIDFRG